MGKRGGNNPENVIKHKITTTERAREIGRLGGIASQKAYRRKKSMQEFARIMNDAPVTGKKAQQVLRALGLEDEEDLTNGAEVVASVLDSARRGDMKAVEKWFELTDTGTQETSVYELPARVIGKAFVDINRNIEPNKQYIFEGGRGGLKSSYVSLKIIELIKNYPTMHACIVRKVAGTLRDSVYSQIKWAINELGLNDEFDFTVSPLEIKYKKTGQVIYFRGCDDPVKLKSIKPTFGYIGILWIEERDQLAGEAEERSVKQSVLRGGNISFDFASYNPPKSKSNWVNKQKEIPNENRIIHHSTYESAPVEWLGQKFIDDALHLKEVNPEAYEHEYIGIPNGDGGNVFEFLEIRTITDEEIERFANIYQGVDWGWYPDPFAFVRVAYERAQDTIYVIDEHVVNKQKNEKTGKWILDNKYDDYIITCDSAEPKSVNDFRDLGIEARGAIKGAGSVDYGMKFLQGRRIVIDPVRTPYTFKEFNEYEYERDKDGEVISGYPDENNHTIDAMRYALEQFYNKRGNNA